MGNSTSRVVGCFVRNGKDGVDLDFLEPLDEGLGHSFCYVRPVIDSPAITPSNSERFTVDSSTLDSETHSGSFRQEIVDDLILQRPNKNVSETTFKTISGASVSANASTARTAAVYDQHVDTQERAASFESTASFAALPLQPVPRGLTLHSGSLSGPLNGFLSGPLERGFASGPLERGSGFMSGPIEKGAFMSGPLDSADKINFSAPLSYSRRRANFGRLMRSMSRPMRNALSRTFSRHPSGPGLMQRVFMRPVAQFMSNYPKDAKFRQEVPRNCLDSSLTSSGIGPSECEYDSRRNLQWAHGKAGEDRVHVVLSEEHGWLFVGIYDGFSGPDAPDFLMSNLYKAIDKELEGLLWDYETNPPELGLSASAVENVGTSSDCRKEAQPVSQTFAGALLNGVEASQAAGNVVVGSDLDKNGAQSNVAHVGDASVTQQASDGVLAESSGEVWQDEIVQEKDDTDRTKLSVASETGQIWWVFPRNSSPNLMGHGRKSKRLYELLQLDDDDVQAVLEVGTSRRASWDSQQSLEDLHCRGKLPLAHSLSRFASSKECGSSCLEEVANSREGGAAVREEPKHGVGSSFSVLEHKQITTGSLIGSKLRKMYKRQRSLRKKLFPWSYDWHRGQTHVIERVADTLAPIRRCKLGPIDHTAVLKAMSRSLEITEDAYMEMVESVLDKNPELALMGSCVLVMLMKDQDVYVMNIGDSRALLAQERLNDRQSNPNLVKDDVRHRNKSRESFVRVELDRISEESPVHNQNNQVNRINRNREISICRLKMRAFQLSTDHSTSVEEEVLRIKAEHIDDDQAIFKDRVKGQLKVTRAFGAGFLKKPKCNDALLEMFRIDYIGTAPYISCAPSVAHHHLSSNDRFLVLSSDGLYQYFSNDEVVSHVQWFMENVPEGDPAQYLIAELLFRAAKKNGMDFHELLDIPHGDRRKYHDDVSVMVVSLEGRIWRSSG